jgi:hypothetical protein
MSKAPLPNNRPAVSVARAKDAYIWFGWNTVLDAINRKGPNIGSLAVSRREAKAQAEHHFGCECIQVGRGLAEELIHSMAEESVARKIAEAARRDECIGEAVRRLKGYLLRLGLTFPCTLDDVRTAYHNRAKLMHPDVGGNHDDFIELNRNYHCVVLLLEVLARASV